MTPFILYGRMGVKYDGRASSILAPGNYVLMYKRDGSLLIHGGSLIAPLNYQQRGAQLAKIETGYISRSKKETIEVTVEAVYSEMQLPDWSDGKIELVKTEKQLADRLSLSGRWTSWQWTR